MEDKRRSELNCAYHALVEHNLWRRGKTTQCVMNPREIGDAIDTAAGAILDLIGVEYELGQQEAITKSTMMMLDRERSEARRLKAILASRRIPYKRKTKGDNKS